MKKLLTVAGLALIMGYAYGQTNFIRCFSDEHLRQQIAQNPERGRKLDALNKQVDDFVSNRGGVHSGSKKPDNPGGGNGGGGNGGGGTTPRNTVYIPVVVNVIYRTNAENISDQQIQSQIEVLNKDYAGNNYEFLHSGNYNWSGYLSSFADMDVQFCLAQTIRKQTTVSSWGTNDAVKKTASGGLDPTDPTGKLNFWVCNLGSGLLGYAQFPGGSSSTDGVVCLYSAFGTSAKGATAFPYDEGRTMTHEVGHWLGLYHTFQGGCSKQNDYVDDTPPTREPFFGCPTTPINSACRNGGYIQTMNYMDYTDDDCMFMFTKGQLARADGFIAGARANYCLASCSANRAITQNRSQKLETEELVTLYPTITRGQATLVIPSAIAGTAAVSVLNQAGTSLQKNNVPVTVGVTKYQLDISNAPAGMYIIKVNRPDGSIATKKLVKQ